MKIICIGRNYVAHAKELGNEVPADPVIFMKPKSALSTNDKPFYYPEFTNELHYECEIVLRICKNGKYIHEQYAYQYFNQITVGIDFTARDIQNELKEKGLPWEKAKAFDGSAVIGTWVNIDANFSKQSVDFSLELNNTTVQKGNSELMIFSFAKILAEASKYFTLNIGDLVFTGTPSGVGECVTGDNLKGFLSTQKLFDIDIK
jgi:2-keto-4-pentenoate hydratase/2-oxohepta-3-ene-1,7-dioic acid hydratase in catechol pathway